MMKILRVITDCKECDHCKVLKDDNYSKAYICNWQDEKSETDHHPFLIHYQETSGTYALEIPHYCPLETYINPET